MAARDVAEARARRYSTIFNSSERSTDMKRILLAAALAAAASTYARGQCGAGQMKRPAGEEAALTQLVREWADAVVHADLQRLEVIEDSTFQGVAEGEKFNKRTFNEALRSGLVKVAGWTIE